MHVEYIDSMGLFLFLGILESALYNTLYTLFLRKVFMKKNLITLLSCFLVFGSPLLHGLHFQASFYKNIKDTQKNKSQKKEDSQSSLNGHNSHINSKEKEMRSQLPLSQEFERDGNYTFENGRCVVS